jgi:hypothetical protein
MADETTETQADATQPGEPQLADIGAVMELVRHLGQILSNTSLYGAQHKVTQQAIGKGFEFLSGFLSKWERVSFSTTENSLLADGRQVEMKNALMTALLKQLSAIEVGSFSLARGMTIEDFSKLMALLNTHPEKMKAMGSFSEALAQSGVSHVQAKSMIYQLVTEEDVVVNKEELEQALAGAGGTGGTGKERGVEEIVAFLKGASGENQIGMNIEEVASDVQQLADLIMKAADVSPEKANLEGAETLGEIIVGCLRRAYQSMLTDPAAKTQQGKKALAKTLMLLQEELLNNLRQLADPDAEAIGEVVADAVDEMTNELQIDALASDYVKKRKGIDTTEKKILRFMKVAGKENPEASEALKEKLLEGGLDVGEWQELLVKSKASGGKKGGGVAGSDALASLLAQMTDLLDPKKTAPGESPPEAQINQLVTQLEQEVAVVTADAEQKLDQLAKRLQDKPTMSKEAMLAMLAEIGQEICQPLAVITCAIDMIRSKALGPVAPSQEEMLVLAAEGGSRLEMLANKIIEISGVPKGTKPDTEILDDVYGR